MRTAAIEWVHPIAQGRYGADPAQTAAAAHAVAMAAYGRGMCARAFAAGRVTAGLPRR
ncbi:hypothetical protein [Streptomyces erythrochromogenes]|uniref:hypothetical protein n=1 Tax=Streptomyces erythrochromogenes TaxID=285574 RepID=UPI0036C7B057